MAISKIFNFDGLAQQMRTVIDRTPRAGHRYPEYQSPPLTRGPLSPVVQAARAPPATRTTGDFPVIKGGDWLLVFAKLYPPFIDPCLNCHNPRTDSEQYFPLR
ncbi:MAG: hypothetical protein ACC707_20070, partial [Thiohalomonadales bacterium]